MKRALIVLAALAAPAWAHKPSDAHVQLVVAGDRIDGTIAVALRDLDGALAIDANGDGSITWREAVAASPRIATYIHARLVLRGDGDACGFELGTGTLSDYSDGAYWSMPLHATCSGSLEITYALLFDLDAQHRGIVQLVTPQGTRTAIVRDPTPVELPTGGGVLAAAATGFTSVTTNLALLLCLAGLVFAAVIERRQRRWVAVALVPAASTAWASTCAFVVASVATTLASALRLVVLPEHVVAIAVVLTVAIAALTNLVRGTGSRWDLAFELGLLHGMASAYVLDALAPTGVSTILAFAFGVAAAQLAGALAIAGGFYAVRRALTRRTAVWACSGVATIGSLIWALSLV